MPKIYLAGPDVFRRDAVERGKRLKQLCADALAVGLYPLDGAPLADASAIRDRCIGLLDQADIVVANISPFRGPHMDPGTAWEIGYAHARGLPVYLWSDDPSPLVLRVALGNIEATGRWDTGDNLIEDFGGVDNLMIAGPGVPVWPTAKDAIRVAAETFAQPDHEAEQRRTAQRGVTVALAIALAAAALGGYLYPLLAGR